MAAATRGIPLVLTEADSHLGVTNRALARFARRVCLAFPIRDRTGDRYLVLLVRRTSKIELSAVMLSPRLASTLRLDGHVVLQNGASPSGRSPLGRRRQHGAIGTAPGARLHR
jgi:UDP-N-acetylglucosamine:LPS N-acetylglucosamine transferase